MQSALPALDAIQVSIDSIKEVLANNQGLEYLSLSKCHISITGSESLAEAVSQHTSLRGLDLSHNPFGTEMKVETIEKLIGQVQSVH